MRRDDRSVYEPNEGSGVLVYFTLLTYLVASVRKSLSNFAPGVSLEYVARTR